MGSRYLTVVQLLWMLGALRSLPAAAATTRASPDEVKKIWEDERPLNQSDVTNLRAEVWSMFDFAYTNYMTHAFPQDNLLPLSCKGVEWQGNMALTLIDSLDTLLLLGRRADMEVAVEQLRKHINFNKKAKVHVFETTIRVLGGLISGHVLLMRDHSLVPEYDGLFLNMAVDLADRLLPAFNTPSGIPKLWAELQGWPIPDANNVTCTACAGTLLLEFGALSALTGKPVYMEKAEHAARLMFLHRSPLGLVGASMDVKNREWVKREASIGPGIDSYYEYLLKAYLMFGKMEYLDMFTELYVSTMRHLQMPLTVKGYQFLVDVNMDNGRVVRPWVSSLGAFWPGMQVLAGLEEEAVALHSNFTAAWRQYGWMPEMFAFDMGKVHGEDPGYNLRPEHIESTWLLHGATANPAYLKVARAVTRTLQHSRVKCGFAGISHVGTGEHIDAMESFFLSETLKYLYLMFSDAPALIDYYLLSTEGHLLPVYERQEEDEESAKLASRKVPVECRKMCGQPSDAEQAAALARVKAAFPLIPINEQDGQTMRRRRCIACVVTVGRLHAQPPVSPMARWRTMNVQQEMDKLHAQQAASVVEAPVKGVLGQVVCGLHIATNFKLHCGSLRKLHDQDIRGGLAANSVVLQLSQVEQPIVHGMLLLLGAGTANNRSALAYTGIPAAFGPALPQMGEDCLPPLLQPSEEDAAGSCTSPASRGYEPVSTCPQPALQVDVGKLDTFLAGDCATAAAAPLMGRVVVAQPNSGCGGTLNGLQIAGAIAVVTRGGCSFMQKVNHLHSLGAIAVVVVNLQGDGELISMAGDSQSTDPTISSMMLSRSNGMDVMAWAMTAPVVGLLGSQTSTVEPPLITNRIDLVIPTSSQAWLQANILNSGRSLNTLFAAVANDQRALNMLTRISTESEQASPGKT